MTDLSLHPVDHDPFPENTPTPLGVDLSSGVQSARQVLDYVGKSIVSPAEAKEAPEEYKILKGDTLGAISQRYNIPIPKLMEMNPQLSDPNKIRAGRTLNLHPGAPPVPAPPAPPPEKPMPPTALVGTVGTEATADTPGSHPYEQGHGVPAEAPSGTPAPGEWPVAEPPAVKEKPQPKAFEVEVVNQPPGDVPIPQAPENPAEAWGPGHSKPYPPGMEKLLYSTFWREFLGDALPTAAMALPAGPAVEGLDAAIEMVRAAGLRRGLTETPELGDFSHETQSTLNWAVKNAGLDIPATQGPWTFRPQDLASLSPKQVKLLRDSMPGAGWKTLEGTNMKEKVQAEEWRLITSEAIAKLTPEQIQGMAQGTKDLLFGRLGGFREGRGMTPAAAPRQVIEDLMNANRPAGPSPLAAVPAGAALNRFEVPAGSKLAPDGQWYVRDPDRPGKYLMVAH